MGLLWGVIEKGAGEREILHISRTAADDTGKWARLADPEWCSAPATPSQVYGRCRSSQPLQVWSLRRTVVERRWVLHSVFWISVRLVTFCCWLVSRNAVSNQIPGRLIKIVRAGMSVMCKAKFLSWSYINVKPANIHTGLKDKLYLWLLLRGSKSHYNCSFSRWNISAHLYIAT